MRGIVADANVEGQVEQLVRLVLAGEWAEYWFHLGLELVTFADVGLRDRSPDAEVWRTAQRERLVLITANRKSEGPSSLEATIRAEGTPDSLPVLTIGDARRLIRDAAYAEQAARKLIEYLVDIDNYRGMGRLYIP